MHLVGRPAGAQRVRDGEIRAVHLVLVVVRLRQKLEARVAPRRKVDRDHVRRGRGAERHERRRYRRLEIAEVRDEARRPPAAVLRRLVRPLRVRDVEVEPEPLDLEMRERRVDQRVLLQRAPAADRDAVRAEHVDPRRVDVVRPETVRHLQRDPREAVALELVRERPRAGEVARVVDEDAGAREEVRRRVGARGRRGAAADEDGGKNNTEPAHYLPLKSGLRFSTNAFRPSAASSDARAR